MTGFGSMFIMDGFCFVVVDLGHGDIMCIHCGECYGESMDRISKTADSHLYMNPLRKESIG